ncbi:MAG: hypothetical protein J6W43_02735 [Prevotella sp.]|nr:hypothetical protein [Prevotella sp.]
MKLKDLPIHSFKTVGRQIGLDARVVDGRLQVRRLLPRPLWAQCLSSKSSFCRAVVQSGLLTHRQMVHAALRYRLGRSKDDGVIYWQIDRMGQVHDGKLMWYGPDCHRLKNRHATWVMYLLKQHYAIPQEAFQPTHIFFGSHLLSEKECVAIVEAEKSAVILSELYPQCLWLAAGGLGEVQPYKFLPLRNYKVILFPDTDLEGRAFTKWYDAAQTVMKSFFWPKDNPIRVSPILERHATPDQKRRKIDLVDYILESQNQ